MDEKGLADGASGAPAGVERRVGVLEDHLDFAPERLQLIAAVPQDVFPIDEDLSRRGILQPHDQPPQGRLPAAAFPHEAERLPPVHLEVHAVDGLHNVVLAAEKPAPNGKMFPHTADVNQYVSHTVCPSIQSFSLQSCLVYLSVLSVWSLRGAKRRSNLERIHFDRWICHVSRGSARNDSFSYSSLRH